MQRSATVLRKLRNRLPSHSGPHPPVRHLCESCQGLILTDEALKQIPKSVLPDGLPSLDLIQGFVDLPVKRKDKLPGFPFISATATQGCSFCQILLRGIEADKTQYGGVWHSKFGDSQREVTISFRYNCVAELGRQSFLPGEWPTMLSTLEALVSIKGPSPDPNPIIIVFKTFGYPNSATARFFRIHWRPTDSTSLSPRLVREMNEWVHECRFNHDACQLEKLGATPSRLIEIGNRQEGRLPRLVETSNFHFEPNMRYVALSYCWGPPGSMRLTTTTDTLEQRYTGIPWEELPLVFNDAFLVTEALGLGYIWIDALCILQDSAQDWEIEAAKMGNVYRGAQVTIVAAKSRSTDEGFLNRDQPEQMVEIPFFSKQHHQASGSYHVAYAPNGHIPEFSPDVEQAAWNTRGWTFQERLLSRRLIFFGAHMTYFECRTHRRAENYEGTLNRNLAFIRHLQSLDSWSMIQMSWRRIIEEYSSRQFTFEKDRLPALAGLAEELHLALNPNTPRYLAGHWGQGLEFDLIWVPSSLPVNNREHDNISASRSPTWSWCSANRPVSWVNGDVRNLRSLCEVVGANVPQARAHGYGAVNGGTLDIRGEVTQYVLDRTLLDQLHGRSWINVEHTKQKNFFLHGFPFYMEFELDFAFDVHISSSRLYKFLSNAVSLALLCDDGKVMYGLVLAETGTEMHSVRDQSGNAMLRTLFQRIGVFKLRSPRYGNIDLALKGLRFDLDEWWGLQKCSYRIS